LPFENLDDVQAEQVSAALDQALRSLFRDNRVKR